MEAGGVLREVASFPSSVGDGASCRRRILVTVKKNHFERKTVNLKEKEFLADESDIYVLFVTATEAVFLDKKYQPCGEILDSLLWMNWNSW